MAFPVLKILFTLIGFLFCCGIQVNCKVEKYTVNIDEKGTSVKEEVEVDVDEQTEVIRVPKHNDVDSLELMNNFTAGLSVRRDPTNKVCYVSKLDSSFSSPGEMKQEMDQVSNQSQPDEVTTESSEWKVVGFAKRSALPQKILEFCGTLPTYEIKIEAIPLDGQDSDRTRSKRYADFTLCSASDRGRLESCRNSPIFRWRYVRKYCFYTAKCSYWGYRCSRFRHYVNYVGRCCSVTCSYDRYNNYRYTGRRSGGNVIPV